MTFYRPIMYSQAMVEREGQRIVAITEQQDFPASESEISGALNEWFVVYPRNTRQGEPVVFTKNLGRFTAFRYHLIPGFPSVNSTTEPRDITAIVEGASELEPSGVTNLGNQILARIAIQLMDVLDIAKPGVLQGDNAAQIALARSLSTRPDWLTKALRDTGRKDEIYDRYGWKVIKASEQQINGFMNMTASQAEEFRGIRGQISMARQLGNMNLGDLFGLASALGQADKLQWKKVALPLATVNDFERLTSEENQPAEKYKGNKGQIRLARELGGSNLGGLYALGAEYGIVEQLGWTNLNAPLEMIDRFLSLVGDPKKPNKRYIGNLGQLQLARDLKEANLQQVFMIGNGLISQETLGWNLLGVPLVAAESFIVLVGDLGNPKSEFKGNKGMLEVARLLNGMNLNQLTAISSGFGINRALEWDRFTCTYRSVIELQKKLIDSEVVRQDFSGFRGQFKLAQMLGIETGQIEALAQTFTDTAEFDWKAIDIFVDNEMLHKLVSIIDSIDPKNNPFRGNKGMFALAKETGITNLGSLHELIKELHSLDEFGWTNFGRVYVDEIEFFLSRVLVNGVINPLYVGNEGQIKMAQDLRGRNLQVVGTMAAGFDLLKKLKWNYLKVPYRIVDQFKQLILDPDQIDAFQGSDGLVKLAKQMNVTAEGLVTLAHGLGATQFNWTYGMVR